MIQKHAIPILEFDDNPQAVIMPNHEGLDLHLPKKCVYCLLYTSPSPRDATLSRMPSSA